MDHQDAAKDHDEAQYRRAVQPLAVDHKPDHGDHGDAKPGPDRIGDAERDAF